MLTQVDDEVAAASVGQPVEVVPERGRRAQVDVAENLHVRPERTGPGQHPHVFSREITHHGTESGLAA
jgi:hypothetical protein